MKKQVVISGLMLFSLFFGAGNLIFPPMLGHMAGDKMWIGMLGFALTGILLPYLTVIVVAFYDEGVESVGNRIHPIFGLIFAIVIYMSIGAFYGIPRAANVAYEIGTRNILPVHNQITLVVFALIFFAIVYWIALNPSKIVDNLGKILTPLLLFDVSLLCISVIFKPEAAPSDAHDKYASNPFVAGGLEGYFTMDLVAALAFSVVIVNGFKVAGITERRSILKNVVLSGLISSLLLVIIYFALAYVGASTGSGDFKDGTDLLTYNSLRVFGRFGDVIFATTVILACLTTCIGLVNACSAFAKKYIPNMSYKLFVLVFSIVGFLFTTLGLDMILKIAVPLLTFIYPVSIVLVLVSFVNMWFKERFRWTYTLAMIPTLLISILQILNSFKLLSGGLKSFFEMLPFAKLDLAWTIPFLVCAIIGFIIDKLLENKHKKATN
ncbi:branched-chain amino acid transport system II carrier protein [Staphylococcus massiliensis]|uniref:branched-chain amino acid transport system II carrier protein n=1 Tax=Staphylococcus massiliensis TaxID=555791 RepID=UPI001EDE08C5|nr:branched-chain amino acid transport system II carrier protein [Staphylococcus massiliensis]MCG3399236.1 branched-chain amino acid transport system II carrier protein [Staphylococcus massiliensis]